jgi:pimeloyl-ACP methyl ester carboxylesterase
LPTSTRRLLILVGAAIALCACTTGPSGRFTVNGHQLAVRCNGGPGPTIVFEAAVGGDHSLWRIAERVEDRALACVYDRAGNGDSSVPDERMTARTDTADLHALLAGADIPRPVIIVGHSYGALVAWIEAVEHPQEVVGLLLIDAAPPSGRHPLESVLTDEQRQTFRDALGDQPHVDFLASVDEAQSVYMSKPGAYTTLITATNSMQPWCDVDLPCTMMQDVALAEAEQFVADHPGARLVRADTSHFVQDDDPDLVVAEIRRLVDLVSGNDGAR